MTGRRSREVEGALQTALIVAAMKAARLAKHWSAREFAEEMTKAGVAWNADVVVNLEHGRRKSLRVHELLTAAYVLDMEQPLDLLVPPESIADSITHGPLYPLTPLIAADPEAVRMWIAGRLGVPLRWGLETGQRRGQEDGAFDKITAPIRERVERGEISERKGDVMRGLIEMAVITRFLASVAKAAQEGDGDGED